MPPGVTAGSQRPWERSSDPAQGHWSTRGSDERRGTDPRAADPRSPPRNAYRWNDYDRFRAEHFRFDGGRYVGRTRYRLGSYVWPRGFGVHVWLAGDWLPPAFFLDGRYALEYWRYGLYPPPPACRWVRVGDDALLVDNFNGEVLDVIYRLFW